MGIRRNAAHTFGWYVYWDILATNDVLRGDPLLPSPARFLPRLEQLELGVMVSEDCRSLPPSW